jgi:hypothetical protein
MVTLQNDTRVKACLFKCQISKLFSHRGHRESRDIRAENGKEFDPVYSKQILQVLAFFFYFLNPNLSVKIGDAPK